LTLHAGAIPAEAGAEALQSKRRTHPQIDRPFRVPRLELVARRGLLSALGLMVTLPIDTWIWLAIFFTYARRDNTDTFASPAQEDA